jgi:hypothetical protein
MTMADNATADAKRNEGRMGKVMLLRSSLRLLRIAQGPSLCLEAVLRAATQGGNYAMPRGAHGYFASPGNHSEMAGMYVTISSAMHIAP